MKNNLPWLTLADRSKIFSEFEKVVAHLLVARHWGVIKRAADPPFGHTELYILDVRGLLVAVGTLRYMLRSHQSDIYYRGQATHYPNLTPSVYRSPAALTGSERTQRVERLDKRLSAIATVFDIKPAVLIEREALAQHYGLPTRCIDLVDHVQTAAWFAYHRAQSRSNAMGDSAGHIYALATDQAEAWAKIIDLRQKPTNWLRPHMQQAQMMFPGAMATNQSNFDYTCVAHFIVPRPLLRIWSNYDYLGEDTMFPHSQIDEGAQFWQQAVEVLEKAGLVSPGMTIAP